jgi:D-ornithine 4,5-aminomutase subunit alpha
MTQDRIERFEQRRATLASMSDEQLKARFWELCDQAVRPMAELAQGHTSPSIERSVLMRMGIDSITARGVVERVLAAGLLGRGAGHVVLRVSRKLGCSMPEAAKAVVATPEVIQELF